MSSRSTKWRQKNRQLLKDLQHNSDQEMLEISGPICESFTEFSPGIDSDSDVLLDNDSDDYGNNIANLDNEEDYQDSDESELNKKWEISGVWYLI